MIELLVIKSFKGKDEGKRVLVPTEKIVTNDIERINTLVSRGFCVITSLDVQPEQVDEDPKEDTDPKKDEDPKEDKKGKNKK